MLLIAAALLLVLYNLQEGEQAAASSNIALKKIDRYLEEPGSGQNQQTELPVCEIDGIHYIGTLEIPARELELPVISEWSYSNLKKAVCRYQGSPYTGNLIIAGHNYRRHFSGLTKLAIGDDIAFTDMNGNRFSYQVLELEKIPGIAVECMGEGEWDMTMFTCDYSGRNRVVVRCIRVD